MAGLFYHFHVKVGGRSGGKSAVAAAAYRAGVDLNITSEKAQTIGQKYAEENETEFRARHNYTRRDGVMHQEIVAPEGAQDWVFDREVLWNKVEDGEKRKDAQLFREVTLGLPNNMDRDHFADLVRGFVQETYVSQGMVADIAIHEPAKHNDERNIHAHVMLTLRELDGDNFSTKKNRDWNNKDLVEDWRKSWEEHLNQAAEDQGLEERADCRSYEDQAKDTGEPALIPQRYKGPKNAAMERQGMEMAVTEYNARVREYNMEGALERVTARQSVFTVEDLKEELLKSGLRGYIVERLRDSDVKKVDDKKIEREINHFVKNYTKHIREEEGVVQLRTKTGRFTSFYTTSKIRSAEERLVARAEKLKAQEEAARLVIKDDAQTASVSEFSEIFDYVQSLGILKTIDVSDKSQDSVIEGLSSYFGTSVPMSILENTAGVDAFLKDMKPFARSKKRTASDNDQDNDVVLPSLIVVKSSSLLSRKQDEQLFQLAGKHGLKLVYMGDTSGASQGLRQGLFGHYSKASKDLNIKSKFANAVRVASDAIAAMASSAKQSSKSHVSLDFNMVQVKEKRATPDRDAKKDFDQVSDRRKKRRPSQNAFARELWKECREKYMPGVKLRRPKGAKPKV